MKDVKKICKIAVIQAAPVMFVQGQYHQGRNHIPLLLIQ